MKYITIEQLVRRKQELIIERDDKMKMLSVGYDNAIAIIDELIKMASVPADSQHDDSMAK